MAKQYPNVKKMLEGISDDKEFNKSVEKELYTRRLSRALSSMRNEKNLSEEQLAEKMGTTKEEVERIEVSKDYLLTVGDLVKYSLATGNKVEMGFTAKDATIVTQIKYHFLRIKALLEKLLDISKDDPAIQSGVSRFTEEAFANFSLMLLEYMQQAAQQPEKTKEKKDEGLIIVPTNPRSAAQNQTVH